MEVIEAAGLRVLTERADYKRVIRATVELPSRVRVRNVAVGITVIPGCLYGIGWLVLGFSGTLGLARDLCVRGLGLLLIVAASNCAWRVAQNSRVRQAFLAYAACFAIVFALILAITS